MTPYFYTCKRPIVKRIWFLVSKLFRNVPFLTSLEMSPFVLVPLLFLVLLFFLLLALFFSLSLACPERSPASP